MPIVNLSDNRPFRNAVLEAAERADVLQAVAGLYRDLAARIDQRKPVCVVSGRCCRFEEYGHRLYVTTLELAAFVGEVKRAGKSEELSGMLRQWGGTGCPFQQERLCGVHAFRPFGCRVFFCDATARQWQEETYEEFHARLKALHEQLDVPYFYVEWRQGIGAVGEAGDPATSA